MTTRTAGSMRPSPECRHSWEIRIVDPHMVLLHSWNLKKKIQIGTACVQSTLPGVESSVC